MTIEQEMDKTVRRMFIHGRVILKLGEPFVPLAHLFSVEGPEEVIAMKFSNAKEKSLMAEYLRRKISSGRYAGITLLFNTAISEVTPGALARRGEKAMKSVDALVVSKQTPVVSELYCLPYVKTGKRFVFRTVQTLTSTKDSDPTFFNLFVRKTNGNSREEETVH